MHNQPCINEFYDLAKAEGVCIDFNKGIDHSSDNALMAKDLANSNANVVVLFSSAHHAEMLLTEVQTLYSSGTSKRWFPFIASSSCMVSKA